MSEFRKTYEKAPEKMTQAEFKIAIVGLLNTIVEKQDSFEEAVVGRLDTINGEVKVVKTHKIYFKLISGIAGGVFFPVLVWLLIKTLTT